VCHRRQPTWAAGLWLLHGMLGLVVSMSVGEGDGVADAGTPCTNSRKAGQEGSTKRNRASSSTTFRDHLPTRSRHAQPSSCLVGSCFAQALPLLQCAAGERGDEVLHCTSRHGGHIRNIHAAMLHGNDWQWLPIEQVTQRTQQRQVAVRIHQAVTATAPEKARFMGLAHLPPTLHHGLLGRPSRGSQ